MGLFYFGSIPQFIKSKEIGMITFVAMGFPAEVAGFQLGA
jgi:hypothetical protein